MFLKTVSRFYMFLKTLFGDSIPAFAVSCRIHRFWSRSKHLQESRDAAGRQRVCHLSYSISDHIFLHVARDEHTAEV